MSDEPAPTKNGLTKRDIEKAAGPIVASTLALQNERDKAIEDYEVLSEKHRQLQIDYAGAVTQTSTALEMLRMVEERHAVAEAEYRNTLATYTAERLEAQERHAADLTATKLELAHAREQTDRIITACLNVLKEKGDAVDLEQASKAALDAIGPQQ